MGCGNSKLNAAKDGKNDKDIKLSAQKEKHGKDPADGAFLVKYDLHEVLGQGAFGVVHRATQKATGKDFAVKMVDVAESKRKDIDQEIEMMQKLQHPCVVKLYEVFPEKVFVCLVLEMYKGGDMIQGMMHHWKTKGMIAIPPMRNLSKMMLDAVAYVHSKDCVHRDVKGDNFMMDYKDVSSERNKIYLSDFGTVCECTATQRLTHQCGTHHYWPPELYKKNYGLKVDVWAVGVVMYGLVSGKFPFKGETEVRSKELSIPKRCPPDGTALISSILERSEDKRFKAATAAADKFFGDLVTAEATEEQTEAFIPEVKEKGANAGVQQRRAELVSRLKKNAGGRTAHAFESETSLQQDSMSFVVADDMGIRTISYKWWQDSQAVDLYKPFERAPKLEDTNISEVEFSNASMMKLLTDHNVPLDGFGKGRARSFADFAAEVHSGQSRLQLDASKHKHIVRVVDIAVVIYQHGEGADAKYLVQQQGDSVKPSFMLPGDKKSPDENVLQTTSRITVQAGLQDIEIHYASTTEFVEEVVDSPSVPGIETIYRKEFVKATIRDKDLAKTPGISTGGKFTAKEGMVYQWLSASACSSKKVNLHPEQGGDFSALVYPPIGLEEHELEQYLTANKIDTSAWGTGTTRTLADFSAELVKGEATLHKMQSGGVKRVVDVVILKLTRKSFGDILIEFEETVKDSKTALKRLPAVKRRSDEHQFLAAHRLITEHLRLNRNHVIIDPTDVRVVDEEMESVSYPGLRTVYRKRFLKGVLDDTFTM